jgi:hypothetical protein
MTLLGALVETPNAIGIWNNSVAEKKLSQNGPSDGKYFALPPWSAESRHQRIE